MHEQCGIGERERAAEIHRVVYVPYCMLTCSDLPCNAAHNQMRIARQLMH